MKPDFYVMKRAPFEKGSNFTILLKAIFFTGWESWEVCISSLREKDEK